MPSEDEIEARPQEVHSCHTDCPCQSGGEPVSDFVEARTEPTQVSKHETGQPCCGPLECADSECWQPESPNGDISGGNATSLPPSNRTVTPIPDEAVQPRRCEPCDVEGYDECRCGRGEQPQDKEARNMAEVEEVRVSNEARLPWEATHAAYTALLGKAKAEFVEMNHTANFDEQINRAKTILLAALPHLHREWARGRTFYDREAAIRADTLAKVRERVEAEIARIRGASNELAPSLNAYMDVFGPRILAAIDKAEA